MKDIFKTKWFTYSTYLLLVLASLLIGFVLLQNNQTLNNVITSFFEVAENRSFDYRQRLKVSHKQPIVNNDIVVLAIDDASLEMLWDKYGEWPIPRKVYADVIHYLEKDKPQAIVFDLLFLKSMKGEKESDNALIAAMNGYDNVYTGFNFDRHEKDVRVPAILPDRLSVKIDNESNVNFKNKYSFTNCRTILPELMEGKVNIGSTNVVRNNDGIIRKFAPIMEYQGKYYPHLTFQAASKILNEKKVTNYTINKNSELIINNSYIPLTEDGDSILNWYGPSGTHTIYPFYKVINSMESGKKTLSFKDKVIFIGTTATSLHDTKSVPVQDSIYPGVEVHATFFNNIVDNNFIKQTPKVTNTLIILAVVAIVGLIVMSCTSTIFAILSTSLFAIGYLFISYYVMELYNIWIPVVMPIIAIILAFALSFLAKYLIKSRDFEYQYKLATIDGLTELYNHRYFQETLQNQIELSKRYNQPFSLIIVDIDFFKKFNDTYGHQAGDAVLKQVAQTLKKNSRTSDYVCRYGGEEMSIILPNTSAEEAVMSANRIHQAVQEKDFQLNATDTGKVTISVGVATFPDNAQTGQELIEFADKGLYYAKEHGRNQVVKIDTVNNEQ